ncbi:MAG: hypothetical protein ACLPX5_05285 [Dissulfurispiraceae bacterium]
MLRVGNGLRNGKNSYKSVQRNVGKSIGNRAPAMFVSQLIRKAESAGGEIGELRAGFGIAALPLGQSGLPVNLMSGR